MFAVFAFYGLGATQFVKWFFGELCWPCVFGVALASGAVAAFVMFALNFADWPSIQKELKSGMCIEATVVCERATRIWLVGSELEGVACDCGNDVLILIGNWWLNESRVDIWKDPTCRKRFPGKCFHMQFLPRSGQVLSVQVIEGPLPIEEPEPFEPMITLDFPKFSEVILVNQTYQSLVVGETEVKRWK